MFKQLRFAAKDIRRNIVTVVLFICELIFAVYFVMLSVGQLVMNFQQLRLMRKLQDYDITSFRIYYAGESMRIDADGRRLLNDILNGATQAYSFISTQYESLPGVDVVIGFGRFGEIFDLAGQIESNAGFKVLVGSNVRGLRIGDEIRIGDMKRLALSVDGRLPEHSSFLSHYYNAGIISLDDCVVILTTLEQWSENCLFIHYDNILGNTCMLNPTSADVDAFIQVVANSSDYSVLPCGFNDQLAKLYDYTCQAYGTMFAFFIAAIVFISIGIVAASLSMIEKNLREYGIHQLYGATPLDLCVRTILYIAVIIVMAFTFSVAYMNESLMPVTCDILYAILAMACSMIFFVSIYPVRVLKSSDAASILRKE